MFLFLRARAEGKYSELALVPLDGIYGQRLVIVGHAGTARPFVLLLPWQLRQYLHSHFEKVFHGGKWVRKLCY